MKALFTTEKDYSSEHFKNHGWDVFLYENLPVLGDYKIVYFRDPFNDANYQPDESAINSLIGRFSQARSIDGIRTFGDIYSFEDKWNQAQIYGELGPKTFLPSVCEFVPGRMLAKKRISQRAKDILFEVDRPKDDSWIYQELLDIKEELRVYSIFGKVIKEATIKTSKATGKVKIVAARELSPVEVDFCERVAAKSGLDFIGIDLVVLTNGDLKVIEVNRSPQFNRFVEFYGEELLWPILGC